MVRSSGKLLSGIFALIDADYKRTTGLFSRTVRDSNGLLHVNLANRDWTLFIAPLHDYGEHSFYHATAHFRIALRGQSPPDRQDERLLKIYLHTLERNDGLLAAAWPGSSADPAVMQILQKYTPYLTAAELPSSRRRPFREIYCNIAHYDFLLRHILNHYLATDNPRLLELGCAYGLFMDLLREQGYRHLVGVDTDDAVVRIASEHALDVRLIDAAVLVPGLGHNCFDAAFAMHFFHHELDFRQVSARVSWVVQVMESVHAVLKPGGRFFCDAEFHLPQERIRSLGFILKHRLSQTKPKPRHPNATIRNDLFIFEKTNDEAG